MPNPLGPWNAWFALSTQAARMCWEAQTVMFLRGLRMAQGGAKAEAEVQRMISEKVAAFAEAQVAATVATLKGSKKHRVAKKALGVYAGRVRRNGSQSKGTGRQAPRFSGGGPPSKLEPRAARAGGV